MENRREPSARVRSPFLGPVEVPSDYERRRPVEAATYGGNFFAAAFWTWTAFVFAAGFLIGAGAMWSMTPVQASTQQTAAQPEVGVSTDSLFQGYLHRHDATEVTALEPVLNVCISYRKDIEEIGQIRAPAWCGRVPTVNVMISIERMRKVINRHDIEPVHYPEAPDAGNEIG